MTNGFVLLNYSSCLSQLIFQHRQPNVVPSLHAHYKHFITTTNNSAPVLCIGTLILINLVICISPLTS